MTEDGLVLGADGQRERGLVAIVPPMWVDAQRRFLPARALATYIESDTYFAPEYSDRATRLAGVIAAWSTLSRFYPYFDQIETD